MRAASAGARGERKMRISLARRLGRSEYVGLIDAQMQRDYVWYRSTVSVAMIMVVINDSVRGGHDCFVL